MSAPLRPIEGVERTSMSTPNVIATPIFGSDGGILAQAGGYCGFSLRNTSSSATATVRIYDGTSAAGTLLDSIQLEVSESAREWYGSAGIQAQTGLYVDVVSGAVEGSIRVSR
jgi:hypothetical protein